MNSMIRTYSELVSISSFEDRYNYLRLNCGVGIQTFGYNRYLNQSFYRSSVWRQFRHRIIVRDNGCDLAIDDRSIGGRIIIHHLNPITENDLENGSSCLLSPENVICVSNDTHQAIHYGDTALLIKEPITRTKNDTSPWIHGGGGV